MKPISKAKINQICNQTLKLCYQKKFSEAKQCWKQLKAGKEYYKFVIPDFAFHNIKATEQDIALTKPAIIKTIYHEPIKIRGMMAHAGKRKYKRHHKHHKKK